MVKRLFHTFKDQNGQDAELCSGHTLTYDISNLPAHEQEAVMDNIAYYGYLASEGEPFNTGEPRENKTTYIKIRLRPSHISKSETHRVTWRDVQENRLLDFLNEKSSQYYIKIRNQRDRGKKVDKV